MDEQQITTNAQGDTNAGVDDNGQQSDGTQTQQSSTTLLGQNDSSNTQGQNQATQSDNTDSDSSDDADEFSKEYIGKPEQYDYTAIKLPEGMILDKEGTAQLNEFASKYNMSNKGACELMNMATANAQKIQQQVLQAQTIELNKRLERDNKIILNDPDIGGAKFEESKKYAEKAYEKFIQCDEETHKLFLNSGLNGNPTVFKMLAAVGKQMQDGKIYSGGPSNNAKKSKAQILFGENK